MQLKLQLNKNVILLFSIVLFSYCDTKNKEVHEEKNKTEVNPVENLEINISEEQLEECINKGIYYLNEVDVSTYKKINTQYFHQVIDYIDTTAQEIEKEFEKLNYILEVDGSHLYSNEQLDSIIFKANTLKKELIKFEKSVVGFVFLHTFLNKQDTISAIIIANADCSKSEAIKVITLTDIEPNYYKQKIRNIEK